MARYRSPYTGHFVSAKRHELQVKAAEARAKKWGKVIARKRISRVKLADALHREYDALNDLAKLKEQEGKGREVSFKELAEDYREAGEPFDFDETYFDDEAEGQEFELRAESEGDTGDAD